MIELFGELYYIDFAELDKFLILDRSGPKKVKTKDVTETFDAEGELLTRIVESREHIKHKEIDGVRYDIIRNFITDLGDEGHEENDEFGSKSLEKTSIRFKLAFNTLLAYGLLKPIED